MVDHTHYTYRVTWSDEDQEFVGLCAEFPSLSHIDENQTTALNGIIALVGEVVEDMKVNNEPLPQPLADKRYSGKFQVRIPAAQHRSLTIQAAEQGVSLNRLVASKLI